jgi:hypothetical protein
LQWGIGERDGGKERQRDRKRKMVRVRGRERDGDVRIEKVGWKVREVE